MLKTMDLIENEIDHIVTQEHFTKLQQQSIVREGDARKVIPIGHHDRHHSSSVSLAINLLNDLLEKP